MIAVSHYDKQELQPAYDRIVEVLRDQIEAGALRPHDPVVSERRLADEYRVSRMTARHALAVLEREGYVYRRRGRGTFVAEPRISVRVGGFTDEVRRAGRTPGAKLLYTEVADPTPLTAEALGLGAGEKVLITQRLRSVDGQPVAKETSYWPASRCPGLLEHVGEGSLWALVRDRYGIVATETDARMEAITLDDATCADLGVSRRSPGFLLTRMTFDANHRCFEFARDLYRGDRSEFRIKVPVESLDGHPQLLAAVVDAT